MRHRDWEFELLLAGVAGQTIQIQPLDDDPSSTRILPQLLAAIVR